MCGDDLVDSVEVEINMAVGFGDVGVELFLEEFCVFAEGDVEVFLCGFELSEWRDLF